MKNENNNMTEVVFILDRSGSMSGLEEDTIGGFNAMIKKQKKAEGNARITTVLFDDKLEVLHNRLDIREVGEITEDEYYVRGCTALLDAIGYTIKEISGMQKKEGENKPEKTIFIITTDGMENSSKHYDYKKVKKMVEKKKEKNWEFIFMGANIDAIEVGAKFGVSASRAVNYTCDSVGTKLNFTAMAGILGSAMKARSAKEMSMCIEEDGALDEIRRDYEKRGAK